MECNTTAMQKAVTTTAEVAIKQWYWEWMFEGGMIKKYRG